MGLGRVEVLIILVQFTSFGAWLWAIVSAANYPELPIALAA